MKKLVASIIISLLTLVTIVVADSYIVIDNNTPNSNRIGDKTWELNINEEGEVKVYFPPDFKLVSSSIEKPFIHSR